MLSPLNKDQQLLRAFGTTTQGAVSSQVTIATTATTIATIDAPGIYRLWVKNIGGTALDSFSIVGRNSPRAAWDTIVSTASQFTTISADVAGFLRASKVLSPVTLADAAEWYGSIDTVDFVYIEIRASVASGSTILDIQLT
jgi:hypothetical protein